MTVPQALLAFLEREPRGVYQLRQLFTAATTWKINIGQVYQTMQRLARDGLAQSAGTEGNAELFSLTPEGRSTVTRWLDEPIMRSQDDRNELVMKIVIAAQTRHDVSAVIQTQRKATIKQLRELTRKKAATSDLTEKLLLEHHIFELDSESRWLDHIEPLALSIEKSARSAFTAQEPSALSSYSQQSAASAIQHPSTSVTPNNTTHPDNNAPAQQPTSADI